LIVFLGDRLCRFDIRKPILRPEKFRVKRYTGGNSLSKNDVRVLALDVVVGQWVG
jgi:hypothetical protein